MLAGYNEKGASIFCPKRCLNNCIKIEWRSYKLIRESKVDEYKKKKMRMQKDSKPTTLKKSTANKQEE